MLIARSNSRTTRTPVSAVTDNRVVGEGVHHTARADQHAVAGVAIDHVLIDRRPGNTDVAGITRTNAIRTVQRDLTIPNEYVREVGSCRVGENTVRGVVREHGVARRYAGTGAGVQAIAIAD